METQVLTHEQELEPIVRTLLTQVVSIAPVQATVVALYGNLGAGKTTLVQTMSRVLGVTESVTSPTFVIQKTYPIEHERWHTLVHIDAYRLDDPQELAVLGFAELLKQADILICIEWADRVSSLLPEHTVPVTLSVMADTTHTITYPSL